MEAVYPTLSLRERDRRWGLCRGLMTARGLDCLIVAGFGARGRFDGYLANDYAEGIAVFPLKDAPTYLTWTNFFVMRHLENRLRGRTPWIEDWRVGTTGAGLVNILREKGCDSATIGVVGLKAQGAGAPEGYIPYETWAYVGQHLPGATFVDVSQPFAEMMLVKSQEELALMRHSAYIGEMACQAMLEVTKPGVSEAEIYATIMKVLFSYGADAPFPTLILQSGGDNASWGAPIWLYQAQRPRQVQQGDLVQAETFTSYGGMATQQQMSVALKPVHQVNQECAEIARRSYMAGLNALRPGKKFQEVADAMEVPLTQAGCWHGCPLIHTVTPPCCVGQMGVGIEEMPGIENYEWIKPVPAIPASGGDVVIKPGMVFSVQPNVSRGKNRVNIGGTVILTEKGVEELNKLTAEMRIVG